MNRRKRRNKYIESELSIGIILFVSLLMGWLVWISNNNSQASLNMSNNQNLLYPNSIVFLGDSITALADWNALFGNKNIVGAGISGNTTNDVIARVNSAVSYKPKKLFLMIGINDLFHGEDLNYILENYRKILTVIRTKSPDTIIYVQSVLPINNDISRLPIVDSQKIINLNVQLQSLVDNEKIFFINLYPSFCGSDNKMYQKYAPDGVHPNAAGYLLWKNLITSYVLNK